MVVSALYPQKVCLYIYLYHSRYKLSFHPKLTNQVNAESSLVRCVKCKTPVKDTDAVLDAVRVGQEALDKAEAFQFSSALGHFIMGYCMILFYLFRV